ncbi:MAG: hypothetical protein ACOC33_02590 [bacterium]
MNECKEIILLREIGAIERLIDIIEARISSHYNILSHLSEEEKDIAIKRYRSVYDFLNFLFETKKYEWNLFIKNERTNKDG